MDIQKLFSSQTAQEAEEALNTVLQAVGAARAEVETLEAARDDVLLLGDDRAAVAHDEKLDAARRKVDRHQAAAKVLEIKYKELVDAEVKAEARKQVAKGRKALDRGREILNEYDKHARAIAALIQELTGVHQTIKTAQKSAAEAGIDVNGLKLPHFVLSESGYHIPEKREKVTCRGAYPPPGINDYRLVRESDTGTDKEKLFEWEGDRVVSASQYVPGRQVLDLTNDQDLQLPDVFDHQRMIWANGKARS